MNNQLIQTIIILKISWEKLRSATRKKRTSLRDKIIIKKEDPSLPVFPQRPLIFLWASEDLGLRNHFRKKLISYKPFRISIYFMKQSCSSCHKEHKAKCEHIK